MKKGLRRYPTLSLYPIHCPALRPDEEGIKTYILSLGVRVGCPALRPDEEGIKTHLPFDKFIGLDMSGLET